jgi:hypothetical protein
MSEASADELFRDLRLLIERGDLRLEFDVVRLDHIDSPVAVEADSNIWVYGLILVCVAAFWQGGTWPGVAAIGMSLLLYFTVARAYWPAASTSGRLAMAVSGVGSGASAESRWSVLAPRAASRPMATGWHWCAASLPV